MLCESSVSLCVTSKSFAIAHGHEEWYEGTGDRGSLMLPRNLSHAEAREEPSQASPPAAILAYVKTHGRMTRREASAMTSLTDEQARYQLRKLVKRGDLEQVGAGRGAYYCAPKTGKNGE